MNIIFDVDGTIWNTTGIVARVWKKAVIKHYPDIKIDITPELMQKEFGKTMAEIMDDILYEIDDMDIRERIYEDCVLFEHEAVEGNTTDISYPGITDVIEKLSANHNVYVVSNCQSGYIELMMEKTGIKSFVKDTECYGDTGFGKAKNIELLLERNALTKEDSVYVGDTIMDKTASDEAGVRFIHATYGFGVIEGYEPKIDSPTELITLIDNL